jgi:hypothetical protein
MLPNAMVATLTFLPFILCSSITTLTSLDFLGFGLPLGSPSLGELLLQGKNNLQAPWLGIAAFLSVAVLLTLLIFIGEAVRDAFDPTRRYKMTQPLLVSIISPSPFASRVKPHRGQRTVAADCRRRNLALVGESGSGKSVSALSVLRLLPHRSAIPAAISAFTAVAAARR